MRNRPILRWALALLVTVFFGVGTAIGGDPAGVDYVRRIKPLLKQRCYACHGALKRKAGLRLDTGAAIRAGGDGGPAVEPGDAESSLLLDRLRDPDPGVRMPPEGSPLSAEQIDLLRAWIDRGAVSPADETPEPDPRRHWAFLPPERPRVPEPRNPEWACNPIDAFLAREHDQRGLTAVPSAEPCVLLRRLYLDLIGLPPTRDELNAFLEAAERDPQGAYEAEVDRLLASPRYGERWARHWMDVWRYSDWYGRRAVPDVLNSYAMIWRWRDWIVRSLNADKPYSRLVEEMLAADEIDPLDQANVVATGFLVRNFYRWNYNLWMKDNVEHTGKAFLGLTLNCAHCHDHKYDPITHEDYFAFRAFFEPLEIRHDRVPGEPDPGPYPDYTYGSSYKPITSGLVRIFDRKLDARTFLYTGGESRNVVAGKPPIDPRVPAFLKPADFRVEPVALAAESANPALLPFVRAEERERRVRAVSDAERAFAALDGRAVASRRALAEVESRRAEREPIAFETDGVTIFAFASESAYSGAWSKAWPEAVSARLALRAAGARLDAARDELISFETRLAADDAQRGFSGSDAADRVRQAVHAERQAALAAAIAQRLAVEETAFRDRAKPKAERDTIAGQLATANAAESKARAALTAAAKPTDVYTPLAPRYPDHSTGRRLALAKWITDRRNPLAARVAVNHVWRWHFQKPLVATTSDFGRNGAAPTHPALLDWLAVEFMESGWGLKHLNRLIVTSNAYRMMSHAVDRSNQTIDADNRFLWRFEPSRMEAEEVRDGLLRVADALEESIGGTDIDYTQGLTRRRRSLYFTHHGEAKMQFLEIFDAPDACDAYKRTTSVIPQQALALTNNELLVNLATRIAGELAGLDEDRFIGTAFEAVLSRPPTPLEFELSAAFLARQADTLKDQKDARERSRRDLIHALFSHNDFVTIH